MKISLCSSEIIKWLKDQSTINHVPPATVVNMNTLVSLLLKNKIYHTSIGNYIFNVLNLESKQGLDESIAKVILVLSRYGGHFTVSNCIVRLEKYLVERLFKDLTSEMADDLTSSIYYLVANHYHLLSLKFVQCIGILTTDVLYSDSSSYYKLNNCLLKHKSSVMILKCLNLSLVLLRNGVFFLDRIDTLSSYSHNSGNCDDSDAIPQRSLEECLRGTLSFTSDENLQSQISEAIRMIQSESSSISSSKDRVMVYEIVEYIRELSHSETSEGRRNPSPIQLEFKKFKLNLESENQNPQKDPVEVSKDHALDLMKRFQEGELQLNLE
eukprot:NODE_929_length_3026_cov_0.256577.p2 type:complete len:326 gc:universal NODE_929_length_3026_cov_0.256577:174-1151(+)